MPESYHPRLMRVIALPPRARMAFLVRIAWRSAQLMFSEPAGRILYPGIQLIEAAAAGRLVAVDHPAIVQLQDLPFLTGVQNTFGEFIAEGARDLGKLFSELAKSNWIDSDIESSSDLERSILDCAGKAMRLIGRAHDRFLVAIERDLELLETAIKEEKWSGSTPVSPGFFGPLWPFGIPGDGGVAGDDWPGKPLESKDADLIVEIEIPENVSDEEIINHISQIAGLADDIHRAYGGKGLKVKDVEVFGEVAAPEGAVR